MERPIKKPSKPKLKDSDSSERVFTLTQNNWGYRRWESNRGDLVEVKVDIKGTGNSVRILINNEKPSIPTTLMGDLGDLNEILKYRRAVESLLK